MSDDERQKQLRAIWGKARAAVDCPACGAGVAHACTTLRGRLMNTAVHSARVRAAGLME